MGLGTVLGVGTGLSVLGGIQQSASQRAQLEAQATALEARAAAERREGAYQEAQIRKQQDQVAGSTVATAVGSGVDVSGSVADLIKENAYNIEMDALTARENKMQQAEVLEVEAANARAAKPSSISTLMGAAGTAASGYAQYKMFGGS